MLISKTGYRILKDGSMKILPVEDTLKSNYKILIMCDVCKTEFETLSSNRTRRLKMGKFDKCSSCAHSGECNSQYGTDRRLLLEHARKFVKNHGRNFTEDVKRKMSETRSKKIASGEINIKSNNRGQKGWYYSNKSNEKFYFDSFLEKFRMIQLDLDSTVIFWSKRHGIKITYKYNNVLKTTVPDFYIKYIDNTICIEEVKGYIKNLDLIKKTATENYCLLNNFQYRFLTQDVLNRNNEYRKFLRQEQESKF